MIDVTMHLFPTSVKSALHTHQVLDEVEQPVVMMEVVVRLRGGKKVEFCHTIAYITRNFVATIWLIISHHRMRNFFISKFQHSICFV